MMAKRTDGLLDQTMARMAESANRTTPELRNISVNGRRTSIRLSLEMWDLLEEISKREDATFEELADRADNIRRDQGCAFTAAMRTLILNYWRQAALQTKPRRRSRRVIPKTADK